MNISNLSLLWVDIREDEDLKCEYVNRSRVKKTLNKYEQYTA